MAQGFVGIIGYQVDIVDDPADGTAVPHLAVMDMYVKAVARAGGRPVVVPVLDPADASGIVADFAAVVVTGGTDVDPLRYGQPRSPRTLDPDPRRDDAELAVCRAAVTADRPLLAICRGSQVLNVALGGTLIQHLDHHMRRDLYNEDVHRVTIAADSGLAALVGTSIGTNSLHHQAIDAIAPNARAVGWAADGTIEAIEVPGAPRVRGVQWHPELLRHREEHLALFRDLLR